MKQAPSGTSAVAIEALRAAERLAKAESWLALQPALGAAPELWPFQAKHWALGSGALLQWPSRWQQRSALALLLSLTFWSQ